MSQYDRLMSDLKNKSCGELSCHDCNKHRLAAADALATLTVVLSDIKRHCGHFTINNETSNLGMFIDMVLQGNGAADPEHDSNEWGT